MAHHAVIYQGKKYWPIKQKGCGSSKDVDTGNLPFAFIDSENDAACPAFMRQFSAVGKTSCTNGNDIPNIWLESTPETDLLWLTQRLKQ